VVDGGDHAVLVGVGKSPPRGRGVQQITGAPGFYGRSGAGHDQLSHRVMSIGVTDPNLLGRGELERSGQRL
jgi:hypothetical protein